MLKDLKLTNMKENAVYGPLKECYKSLLLYLKYFIRMFVFLSNICSKEARLGFPSWRHCARLVHAIIDGGKHCPHL